MKNSRIQDMMAMANQLLTQAEAVSGVKLLVEDNSKKLQQLESELKDYKNKVSELENGPKEITQGQRERLNERVRLLAVKLNVPYAAIWRKVHDMTGRKCIEEYLFEDYGAAVEYLRRVFSKNNITW